MARNILQGALLAALYASSTAVAAIISAPTSPNPPPITTTSGAADSSAPPPTTVVPGEYSIESLPAYKSLTVSCVQNCLLPIGLDEPTNCDDQTNDCACLSAPVEAEDAITSCISAVCGAGGGSNAAPTASLAAYASIATSMYQSYCAARYPASLLASATAADLAAISSMDASMSMDTTTMSSMSGMAMTTTAPSSTASVTQTATGSSSASAASKTNGGGALLPDRLLGALVGGALAAAVAL